MDDGMPQEMPRWEGLSALAQAALAMFGLHQALVSAGFTDDQALRLVAYSAGAGRPPETPS